MINVTDILSKEVLSLSDAAPIGIIANVYMSPDLSRIRGWTVVEEESDDEKLLPLPRIIGRTDVVTVMNISALKTPCGVKCPLGMRVYDSEGRALGILREVIADETGKTATLSIGEKDYAPSDVLRASRSGVILRSPAHGDLHVKRAPAKKSRRPRPAAQPASVVQDVAPETETLPQATPAISYGEYAFLLGRTVSKDIVADGRMIAKEGTQVDAEIIEKARKQGKLVELTVNSKKV
ncbi:MAG: hypothetical protein IJU10_01375 [Clostridia bacterium]|nr:hypothetical protein [Clostridia bacterium]